MDTVSSTFISSLNFPVFLCFAKPNALPIIAPLLGLLVIFIFVSLPIVYFIKDEFIKEKICIIYFLGGLGCLVVGVGCLLSVVFGFIGSLFEGKSIFKVSPFGLLASGIGLVALGSGICFIAYKLAPEKSEQESENESLPYKEKSDYVMLNLND